MPLCGLRLSLQVEPLRASDPLLFMGAHPEKGDLFWCSGSYPHSSTMQYTADLRYQYLILQRQTPAEVTTTLYS